MKMQRNQRSPSCVLSVGVRGPLLFAGVLAGLLSPGRVLASEEFPAELKKVVSELDCKPACMTCHSTEPGEAGTARQGGTPFAAAMIENGLVAGDVDSVGKAYDKLLVDNPDNVDLTLSWAPCQGEVVYGCGAQMAPGPAPSAPARPWALLAGLLALGVGLRRFLGAAK
jgi:hypothetical protein